MNEYLRNNLISKKLFKTTTINTSHWEFPTKQKSLNYKTSSVNFIKDETISTSEKNLSAQVIPSIRKIDQHQSRTSHFEKKRREEELNEHLQKISQENLYYLFENHFDPKEAEELRTILEIPEPDISSKQYTIRKSSQVPKKYQIKPLFEIKIERDHFKKKSKSTVSNPYRKFLLRLEESISPENIQEGNDKLAREQNEKKLVEMAKQFSDWIGDMKSERKPYEESDSEKYKPFVDTELIFQKFQIDGISSHPEQNILINVKELVFVPEELRHLASKEQLNKVNLKDVFKEQE